MLYCRAYVTVRS